MRGAHRLLTAAATFSFFLAVPCSAREFDPAALDLAALIECRADVPAYGAFAFWFAGEPGAAEKLGWRPVETENLFLQQFRTDRPVAVFGRQAWEVAFTATGPMAILDGVAAPDLARQLGIEPVVATERKFLGEKVVVERVETIDGVAYTTRISINIATVDSHPGKVLAGCSYAMEVK